MLSNDEVLPSADWTSIKAGMWIDEAWMFLYSELEK